MPGTRPGHLEVTNTGRDTILLRRVWKTDDGKAPTEADEKVESYQLHLGSGDDDNADAREAGVLQPTQLVPSWALERYRKLPLFQSMEAKRRVLVRRAA